MRLNKFSKYLGDYTINSVRDLKIQKDFNEIYYECSKPLFSSNEFGLLNYDYKFWYDRAAQFGEDIKKNNPHSDAIKKIDTIIEKIEVFDAFNNIINNILFGILLLSGFLGFGLVILFGFKLSGIVEIIISFISVIALVVFLGVILLHRVKDSLIFRRDLEKTIMRRLIITPKQLEKDYTTNEKIFVANIWNNSLKNKSSLSVLFFFTIFKKWFPNLYQIFLFTACQNLPTCVPNFIRTQNNKELKRCLIITFKNHFKEIVGKIIEKFGAKIQSFVLCITIFTIFLLILSVITLQNWIVIAIEFFIITIGIIDLFFSRK